MHLRDKLLYVGREGPFPDLGDLLVEEAGLGDGDGDLYGQHIVDVFVGDLVTVGYEALSAVFIVQPRLSSSAEQEVNTVDVVQQQRTAAIVIRIFFIIGEF